MADDFTYLSLGVQQSTHKVVATNVTERIRGLQSVLQYIPEGTAQPERMRGYSVSDNKIAGWLCRQKTEGKWKRVWCEYSAGQFTQLKGSPATGGTTPKACGSVQVSFIEREVAGEKNASKFGGSPAPFGNSAAGEKQYDELYWSYLESHEATFSFKLFSPNRIEIFRAETEELCQRFVTAIQTDLKESMDEKLWNQKLTALREMSPLLREQLMLQLNRYNTLVTSLAKSGFMEDDLPITSTRKEKCGVLKMEVFNEEAQEMVWKDFYFVLFEGALFYYKDSKSTTPTGFMTLRFASVELDKEQLTKKEKGFIFHVKTPLRTVVCKCKHPVALSEWIASLQNGLNEFKTENAKSPRKAKALLRRKDSMEVLRDINQVMADVSTFKAIVTNVKTVSMFKRFLKTKEQNIRDVDFYNDASEFATIKDYALIGDKASEIAEQYFEHYTEETKQSAVEIPDEMLKAIQDSIANRTVTEKTFNQALLHIQRRMNSVFAEFKNSPDYENVKDMVGEDIIVDQRQVDCFPTDTTQQFVIKVKGSKRSKEVTLKKKSKGNEVIQLTIGRDKSNYLVIDDSRVSRSHARVEYTDTQCEYVDLGSSCGSRLNGSKVLRAKLQPGDVIEIGLSSLIFQLKKKKRFSIL